MTDYDIAIVGLGPTGLTLAHLLGRHGLQVLVLEREPEFYGNARAVYTDDEALRVFQTAGVADEIHRDMNVDSAVQWITADGTVLVQFREPSRRMWWPITNFLYQPYLETTLEQLLSRYQNVTVRRSREVTGFTDTGTHVAVDHAPTSGGGYGTAHGLVDTTKTEQVTASYLIGADGGRSVVRTALGIDMTGKSYPERWLVVDLKAKQGVDAFRHLPYFDFVCDPSMPTVSCPQPGGHHRFEFALTDDDDKQHFESDATVQRLISRFVDTDQVEVKRRLVYTFNAVVADRWRQGRILLAGDAAHMTPQFIGQGMNAGIRDADNLSWKLAAVLQQGADPALLDTYESERRPHAKAMIDLSVLNKSLVSEKSKVRAKCRDIGLKSALHIPGLAGWVRRAGMKPKPRFKRGAYFGLPRKPLRGIEGTLPPQPTMRTYDGKQIRLDDALGIGWTVIGFEIDPRDTLGDDVDAWSSIEATYATVYRAGHRPQGPTGDSSGRTGLVDLEDTEGILTRWLTKAGHQPGTLVVLRPDRYVFGAETDGQKLTHALTQLFRPGRRQSLPTTLPHSTEADIPA
ncbi:bifunctional 3-(3-hydroxy-phenyl)propionate/3-hydroxycinnamic acid hydroxylase [Gordonia sp. UBA7599]|uniref:bifunctional 3-(3-hydroxy-phenyl)propionate/3-hydroxycinnamic acid hydroxylase MhpA n=1 Tax=unclassified Gordonia (in: high G+C Gram-positive bacteria) TaxID=2657482 RepID=UPI000F97C3F7|nr:bifunctional 3-(3-hydroxy-phenyl)propionate/3-hydroxycinnamic acid hydroxylase [Gordonia sp. UBA7599]RUP38617.1 MAG: bifunctional 3-(3-hydroxy-phenyl)propionate/3-hydroxycinnamic acid hydroxylase [Gordonia sp. (in: high G+C Gram-positive bacteria)]HNP56223.1 bifunctional 3-(3-hydroxy-phenyl)propionate/3-hydroxycinnamic acid hydroxylase [Gordonia sp. (in: high G+C Gram-positive bacteria)]